MWKGNGRIDIGTDILADCNSFVTVGDYNFLGIGCFDFDKQLTPIKLKDLNWEMGMDYPGPELNHGPCLPG